MYIMAAGGKQIINSEFVERFCLSEKEDAVLIVASYSDTRPTVTMARYANMDESRDALGKLMGALAGGQAYFDMPESILYYEEHVRKDARVKRRGGS